MTTNKIFLKDFVMNWYTDYKCNTLAMNTRLSYLSSINKYVILYLGNILIADVSPLSIQ